MQLILKSYKLKLRHTFTISRESYDTQPSLIIELKEKNISGYGEATSNPYYKITVPKMIEDLNALKSLIEETTNLSPEAFWGKMYPHLKHNMFALCALDLAYNEGYTFWTDFLFQGMFAATAATIVSGAVAERMKIGPFMIFTMIYVGLIYPIAGSWKWGGGFLDQLSTPFYDFAGSTLVHSVGGWAALVAVCLLGSRIGKFKDGKIQAIPGHNIPLATAGVLILWLGWFGFNGGSVLSADPGLTSLTLVTTCLAAASGGVVAALVSTIRYNNLDLTMFLNGILGGIVGITAGADQMSPTDAILIGAIAGAIIVFAVSFIDRLKLDDPVGAIAVHLVCGIWGTLAIGIFGNLASGAQFFSQLIGVVSYAAICIISSFIILYGLKKTVGIRVSEREELEGLDAHEHGMDAYPDFRMNEH